MLARFTVGLVHEIGPMFYALVEDRNARLVHARILVIFGPLDRQFAWKAAATVGSSVVNALSNGGRNTVSHSLKRT